MKTIFIIIVVLFFSVQSQAQFLRKLGDKAIEAAGRTVERKVEEKSEKTTGDASDKVLNPKKKSSGETNSSKENSNEPKSKKEKTSKKAEVKSAKDFVPGNKVLVFEDFSQDAIGDFPVNWLTNSSGEVVTISGTPQRWLKLSNKGAFTITDIKQLPENFTLEFEVYVNEGSFSFYSSYLNVGIVESKKKNDYIKWEEYGNGSEGVFMRMFPTVADAFQEGKLGRSEVRVYSEGEKIIGNDLDTPAFNYTKNNHVKVQIWRQKNRLRMYIGDKKVWDLPNAFQQVKYNSVVFYIHDYHNEEDKYYISNFRLAEATGDTRHKLLETGSFVTNEILFDYGKATIKPSSSKVIDEIGTVLKDNPKIKVSISGHTDSDGDEKKNLQLSEQRAMAVKTELVRKFDLNEDNIQIFGLGETQPVSKNNTEEGKKQNRRVEFKIIK
ncbi:OmpA family protein [Flavobacterium swingsii]|uniref:OmpA family protein n=1 Tax=Flavobacterium swingsii TaxID=498292 RepID=A0A1I0YGY3_9FLAO|nr:OmpA family protein [Flavobacterium swingsii]SFB12594.1 OmpA family protein [Flavobacterium swingsii]